MRRLTLSFAFTAAMLAGTAGAFAQAVVITPEQETRVRTIVRSAPAVTIRETVRVGTPLPEDVELQTLPEDVDVSLRPYRYVVWNDRVVLVEPGTRRVVRIIE